MMTSDCGYPLTMVPFSSENSQDFVEWSLADRPHCRLLDLATFGICDSPRFAC